MYGVSNITTAENLMLISYRKVDAAFFAATLTTLEQAGVVIDMISQTATSGHQISFSFTASYDNFELVLQTLGSSGEDAVSPMISGGYSKLNLFGEEMVVSVGVAARALRALSEVEIAMITTSDLDISVLVRQEDEDIALNALKADFRL